MGTNAQLALCGKAPPIYFTLTSSMSDRVAALLKGERMGSKKLKKFEIVKGMSILQARRKKTMALLWYEDDTVKP